MKITILGGTGFIGKHLCQFLCQDGHSLTLLSRTPKKARLLTEPSINCIQWDPLAWGELEKVFKETDAIINLVGESIADARWTQSRKQIIRESRVQTTHRIVSALSNITQRPTILINASGIGFYGHQETAVVTEKSGSGHGFLADLCRDWEREAGRAKEFGVRVVQLRIGMVLGIEGGALPKMLLPFRLFLGGPIGPGNQIVSWIHYQDLVHLIKLSLENSDVNGPINAVSPNPVHMRDFCKTLGRVLGRPSWAPVPAFALRMALGEMATLLTTGQQVKPAVAERNGFSYDYPELELALTSLLKGLKQ